MSVSTCNTSMLSYIVQNTLAVICITNTRYTKWEGDVNRNSCLFTGIMVHALMMKKQAAIWLNYSSLVSSIWLFHSRKETPPNHPIHLLREIASKWAHAVLSRVVRGPTVHVSWFIWIVLLFLHEHALQQFCLMQTASHLARVYLHRWDTPLVQGTAVAWTVACPQEQHHCPDHTSHSHSRSQWG